MIEYEQKSSEGVTLEPEGEQIVAEGSHEKRIYDAIKENGSKWPLKDLPKIIDLVATTSSATSTKALCLNRVIHAGAEHLDLQLRPSNCSTDQTATDRKSTRLNSSHSGESRMPSSA